MLTALQDPYLPNPFAEPVESEPACCDAVRGDLMMEGGLLKGELGFISGVRIHTVEQQPDWIANAKPPTLKCDPTMLGHITVRHVDAAGNSGPLCVGPGVPIAAGEVITNEHIEKAKAALLAPPPSNLTVSLAIHQLHVGSLEKQLEVKEKCIAVLEAENIKLRAQVTALQQPATKPVDPELEAFYRLCDEFPDIKTCDFERNELAKAVYCHVTTRDGKVSHSVADILLSANPLRLAEQRMRALLNSQGYGARVAAAQWDAIPPASPGQPPQSIGQCFQGQLGIPNQSEKINSIWANSLTSTAKHGSKI